MSQTLASLTLNLTSSAQLNFVPLIHYARVAHTTQCSMKVFMSELNVLVDEQHPVFSRRYESMTIV